MAHELTLKYLINQIFVLLLKHNEIDDFRWSLYGRRKNNPLRYICIKHHGEFL